jgi:ubiquinone/menaquinone biosynthesis C-methylase UbiE
VIAAGTDRRVLNSQYAYWESVTRLLDRVGSWLDLGCGHQFVPSWVARNVTLPARCRAVGVDADINSLRQHGQLDGRILANIEHLPIAGGRFDLVTANMVVEHVKNPAELFGEVARVLKPGGSFLVHTPNARGYTTRLARTIPGGLRPAVAGLLQGRKEEDVYPTFYRANTTGELRALALSNGFRVADMTTVASSPQLYKVPVVGKLEASFLRRLASDRLQQLRPCIIARFLKA